MRLRKLIGQLTVLLFASLAACTATRPAFAALPPCAVLASNPANGLAGGPGIKSASGAIVPASGSNAAYCLVHLLYGTNPEQNINILVQLPPTLADGGQGGGQAPWNGPTQGLGG